MKIFANQKALLALRDDVQDSGALSQKPEKFKSVLYFFKYIRYSVTLAVREPELLLFVFLQWLAVGIGYYLFVMMLYWIPPEVWESTKDSDEGSLADMILLCWIIICIGVAALPLSIFSSCMMVVHLVRYHEKKPSSIAYCLKVVTPRAWSLWLFHWLDGLITVWQIVRRMPGKKRRETITGKIASEALYYVWKVTTMGILPNLVTGRTLADTRHHTMEMIKAHGGELLRIRAGYSILCWIIAIATYVIGVFNYTWIKDRFFPGALEDTVGQFYFAAGIPLLLSIAIIQLFLRPAYVIALSDVYARYMKDRGETLIPVSAPGSALRILIVFLILCFIIFGLYCGRYSLGIMDMLATPHGVEYQK